MPNRHPHPGVFDTDTSRGGNLGPDGARPVRAIPHGAALLPRHGDEAEVSDRCSVCLGIAVYDDDAQAAPGGRQCRGKTDDSGTDDREVKSV